MKTVELNTHKVTCEGDEDLEYWIVLAINVSSAHK